MRNANRHASYIFQASGGTLALVGAGLLILLGIVLQLGELGYGASGHFWLISMMAESLWDMLAVRLNVPTVEDVLRFWPLLLVLAGCGTLLALKPGNRASLGRASGTGQDHEQ